MEIIFIVLACFVYLSVAGFFYGRHYKALVAKHGCADTYCSVEHGGAAFFLSAFWLLTTPFLLGIGLAGGDDALLKTKGLKEKERREAELDEARHKAEVARLQRIENDEITRLLNPDVEERIRGIFDDGREHRKALSMSRRG